MFEKSISAVIAHPWRTIAGWLIVVIGIIAFAPSLDDYVNGNQQAFLPGSFESVAAQNVGQQQFPAQTGAGGTIVVTRGDGAPLTQDDQQRALGLAQTLTDQHIPGVVAVSASPRSISPDQKVAALGVSFAGQPGDDVVNKAVDEVRTNADATFSGSDLQAGLTGNAAILVDTNHAYDGADRVISIATVVIILLLLGLVFRSPIIAVIPIVLIGAVFTAAKGVTAWAADLFDFQVSTSLSSIMIVVLFGVGADYIVFLLFRYRERLRDGQDPRQALTAACASVGRVIASSALTVIGAFAALFLARLGSLTSLAPGLIISVAAMLLTALTVVPAIFALLGDRLFWPSGPGRHRESPAIASISTTVAHRPAIVAAGIVLILIVLGVFASGYRATYNTLGELPSTTKSQQAYNNLAASMPAGALSPTQIYVQSQNPLDPGQLQQFASAVAAAPHVASVGSPQLNADNDVALFSVILDQNPYSATALDAIGPLRTAAHTALPDADVLVGGQTAVLTDVRSQLHDDTELVFPVAALIVVAILALLLRSVLAPINLIVAVGLTFAATLGLLTLIFLHGMNLDGIDFTTPIVLYLFVVAIGTDYNILIAERVRDEFRQGHPPAESSRIAVLMDAPTVAVAGTILALTFASLTLTGLDNLTELGTGVALGVAIASLVMAPLLIPSLATLGRSAFWWPTKPPTGAPAPERTGTP